MVKLPLEGESLELRAKLWEIVCDDLVWLAMTGKLRLTALDDCVSGQIWEQLNLSKIGVMVNDEQVVLLPEREQVHVDDLPWSCRQFM